MKRFLIATLILFVLVGGIVTLDVYRTGSFRSRARSIKIGDSKQQVERILGPATSVFTPLPEAATNVLALLLSVRCETWAYGNRLELREPFQAEFPYFFPLRFRLFKPDSDDVRIEFDSAGQVSFVRIPEN